MLPRSFLISLWRHTCKAFTFIYHCFSNHRILLPYVHFNYLFHLNAMLDIHFILTYIKIIIYGDYYIFHCAVISRFPKYMNDLYFLKTRFYHCMSRSTWLTKMLLNCFTGGIAHYCNENHWLLVHFKVFWC